MEDPHRIARIEGKIAAQACMIEALINSHPYLELLMEEWRRRSSRWQANALLAANEPPDAGTPAELQAIQEALAQMDQYLSLRAQRLPPASRG